MKKSLLFDADTGEMVRLIDKPEERLTMEDLSVFDDEQVFLVVEWEEETDKVSFCPPVGPSPVWEGRTRSEFADDAALWAALEKWIEETF